MASAGGGSATKASPARAKPGGGMQVGAKGADGKVAIPQAGQQIGDSIILEEEIDPSYEPTEDETIEYAKWLGMDIDEDK